MKLINDNFYLQGNGKIEQMDGSKKAWIVYFNIASNANTTRF